MLALKLSGVQNYFWHIGHIEGHQFPNPLVYLNAILFIILKVIS